MPGANTSPTAPGLPPVGLCPGSAAAAPSRPSRNGSSLYPLPGDQGGLQGARHVGGHLESGLVDHGLDVLQKRDDVALIGDVSIDRLVAGNAPGLVPFAPQ